MNRPDIVKSTLRPSADVVACELAEGAAILDLRSGVYFGLNAVAAQVWRSIETGASFEKVCTDVCERFEVTAATCEADVSALLEQLAQAGLIEACENELS